MGKLMSFLGVMVVLSLSSVYLCACSYSVRGSEVSEGPNLSYYEDGLPYDEDGILKYNYIEADSVRGQAFLSAFKTQFPELTGGAGRPDHYIISTGNKLCAEIEWNQRSRNYTMTFDEMKSFVVPRVEGGNVDRVATREEADGIVRLALNTLCIEYRDLLPV